MATEPNQIRHRIQRAAYEKCIPIQVVFEVTVRCNLRCHHCYNFDRAEPRPLARSREELTPEEVLSIIDQLAEAGTLYLAFSGGEALMHPNLLDFVGQARRRYMLVRLKSNGIRLTPAAARELVEAGVHSADITLYGATEETYHAFTRVPGALEQTLRGIDAAKEAGMKVRLSFGLMRTNIHELEAMMELARSRGLNYTMDPHVTARYDGTRDSMELRLDGPSLRRLYESTLRQMLRGPSNRLDLPPQCSCARSVCGITAFGEVYPCIGAPVPSGNLRDKSFAEIWKDSPVLNRIRSLKLDDFPVCKPCPDRAFCRRSSGAVYSNTGDYTGPEAWTCMEAGILHELHDAGVRGDAAPDENTVQRFSVEPE
ncbi:MAG: radical SAM protein [Nitrospirae bacterium]|nr:radical SAM protein [Nitrospirota bacterium]